MIELRHARFTIARRNGRRQPVPDRQPEHAKTLFGLAHLTDSLETNSKYFDRAFIIGTQFQNILLLRMVRASALPVSLFLARGTRRSDERRDAIRNISALKAILY
jgi:hypothetical protein